MADAGFVTFWEFRAAPGRQAEFERNYGPGGPWVPLFRRAPGYVGSELLQDRTDPLRYLTVDRWESIEAWRAFRQRFGAEYERLDRELEGLTARESQIGEFAPAGG